MRGRWRRPAARSTGQPAPATPSTFGVVENIHEAKETLSGSHASGYEGGTQKRPDDLETQQQPEASAPCGCQENDQAPCACEENEENCGCQSTEEQPAEDCGCAQKFPENCECTSEKVVSEDGEISIEQVSCVCEAPEADETPAQAADEQSAASDDEAELLKTDWRQERKRYVGLRPDPADHKPERVRSRPYDETAHRAERPEGEREQRPRHERARGNRLHTETADKPRPTEYAPSRERDRRQGDRYQDQRAAKQAPKKVGLIGKIKNFLGLGKKSESAEKKSDSGKRHDNRGNYRQGGRGNYNRGGNRRRRGNRGGYNRNRQSNGPRQ